jgi:transcription elongation factor GreA
MKRKITLETFKKLKEELEYLKKEKRREIARILKHTASFGDLSENFAYQQAKEEQAFVEGRIRELESILSEAEILQNNESKTIVDVGSVVTLTSNGKEEKFQIVDPEEANPKERKISLKSPLGQALINKKVGDTVEIQTLNGKIKYKILKIE